MFIGCLVIVIGTCVQASCHNLAGFMGGRFILGFGVAITSTAGPAYASEMAHPAWRGVLTGIFNTFWFVGGIPGTFVPYGTSSMNGTIAWRIPVWLQMVFSGVVLFSSPFLPETPRWLIANDRHEEALDIMVKHLHEPGSFPDANNFSRPSITVRVAETLQSCSSNTRKWSKIFPLRGLTSAGGITVSFSTAASNATEQCLFSPWVSSARYILKVFHFPVSQH